MVNVYKKRVIAFIDILGFKNLLNSKECYEIAQILDIFYNVQSQSKKVHTARAVSVMSDSLVISFDINESSGVFYCLLELLWISIECARIGVFIRGGVTVGDIFHDEKYCFGNGFVKAYNLEKLANYPRIVIDNNVLSTGIENRVSRHDEEQENEYIRNLLAMDCDGQYYIDYVGKPALEEMECVGVGEYAHYLNFICSAISVELEKYKNDDKIKQKYLWLARRYNDIVKDYIVMDYPSEIDFHEKSEYCTIFKVYKNLKIINL